MRKQICVWTGSLSSWKKNQEYQKKQEELKKEKEQMEESYRMDQMKIHYKSIR